jgi:hypothetical protein
VAELDIASCKEHFSRKACIAGYLPLMTAPFVDLQMRCEKIVLCETAADAQRAIHAANVLAVYCPDGSRRYKKRSTLVRALTGPKLAFCLYET